MVGGYNGTSLSRAESYNASTDTWSPRSPLPTARDGLAMATVTIGGDAGLLAIGGVGGTSVAEFYNLATGTWTPVMPLGTGRSVLAAAPVTIAGVSGVLAMGGVSGAPVASVEFYDPTNNTWTPKNPMQTARAYFAAVPMMIAGDAGVLAIGGNNGAGLASVEFYNPVTNTWIYVASLDGGRNDHAAAPVRMNGVAGVLAVGGSNGPNLPLRTVEFYDPIANTWTAQAPLLTGRADPAAVPLTSGGVTGVLAVAGWNPTSTIYSSTEFFDPTIGTWSARASLDGGRYGLAAASLLQPVSCTPVVIASAQSAPNGIAFDSANVYWVTTPALRRAAKSGGAAVDVVTGLSGTVGLAVDGTSAYFSTASGEIRKVDLDGGNSITLVPSSALSAGDVRVDGAYVYFGRQSSSNGTLEKVAKSGGSVIPLFSGRIGESKLSIDGTSIYFADNSSIVAKVSLDGGAAVTLASGEPTPRWTATDGVNVYWSTNGGTIMKALVDGGTKVALATAQTFPSALAADSTHVYWYNWDPTNATIRKVPIDGGAVEILASGQQYPGDIAVDATHVYWTNAHASGSVMKVPKSCP